MIRISFNFFLVFSEFLIINTYIDFTIRKSVRRKFKDELIKRKRTQ